MENLNALELNILRKALLVYERAIHMAGIEADQIALTKDKVNILLDNQLKP